MNESLIIGLVTLVLCGAMCFYMYMRMTFLEKKVVVMDSILVDMKIALDSIFMQHHSQPVPISHTPGPHLSAPVPLDLSDAEVPEEKFYSSVLEQAHAEDGAEAEAKAEAEAEAEGEAEAAKVEKAEAVPAPVVDLDAMTRQDLVSLAEKKGIRVRRNMNRAEVLALLRRADPTQNAPSSTGAENVSGSNGSSLGASVDGNLSMDLGTNGATLEES